MALFLRKALTSSRIDPPSLLEEFPTISPACARLTEHSLGEAARCDPSLLLPTETAVYAICSIDCFSWRVSLLQFLGTVGASTPRVLSAIWTFLLKLPSWQRGGKFLSDRSSARTLSSSSTDLKWEKSSSATGAQRRQSLISELENVVRAKAEAAIDDSITFRLFSCLSSRCLSLYGFTPSPIPYLNWALNAVFVHLRSLGTLSPRCNYNKPFIQSKQV